MVMLALLIALASDTRAYDRCMTTGDAAAGVTVAMMNCIGTETARQDARLNQIYRARIAALPPARATALRSAERRWIAARDAHCRSATKGEGNGSLGAILYAECILGEIAARIRWLQAAH